MRRAISSWLGLALLAAPLAVAAQTPGAEQSLYKRLGGYDALAAVTDDFLGRLMADPRVKRFFDGHPEETKRRIRQMVVDKLCEATGGPCYYVGLDMRTAHEGMGIGEKDWEASVKHLQATLDHFKVPAREKGEVLAFVSSLKKDIVEKR